MVNESIVLGHLVSTRGIEVDQEKIEVIDKLTPPPLRGKLGVSLDMPVFSVNSLRTSLRFLNP